MFQFCSNIVQIVTQACSETDTIVFHLDECPHPSENIGFNSVHNMSTRVSTPSDDSVYGLDIGLLSMWAHYKANDLVRTFPRAKTFRPLNSVDGANGVVWVGDSNNADSYAHRII